eukprot:646850-Rhodomonas_salina.1
MDCKDAVNDSGGDVHDSPGAGGTSGDVRVAGKGVWCGKGAGCGSAKVGGTSSYVEGVEWASVEGRRARDE